MWKAKRPPLAQLHKQQKHLQIGKALEYAAGVGALDDCPSSPTPYTLSYLTHSYVLLIFSGHYQNAILPMKQVVLCLRPVFSVGTL